MSIHSLHINRESKKNKEWEVKPSLSMWVKALKDHQRPFQ